LAVAADSGGNSGGRWRRAHLLSAASWPTEAKFLNQKEKDWIAAELAQEEQKKLASHNISAGKALLNKRVWHLGLAGFTLNTGMYSMNFGCRSW